MAILTFLIFLSAYSPEALKGIVLDSGGAAVSGAKVEVSAAGFSQSALTNETGAFVVEDLSAGAYSLRTLFLGAAVDGYEIHMGRTRCVIPVDRFITKDAVYLMVCGIPTRVK